MGRWRPWGDGGRYLHRGRQTRCISATAAIPPSAGAAISARAAISVAAVISAATAHSDAAAISAILTTAVIPAEMGAGDGGHGRDDGDRGHVGDGGMVAEEGMAAPYLSRGRHRPTYLRRGPGHELLCLACA